MSLALTERLKLMANALSSRAVAVVAGGSLADAEARRHPGRPAERPHPRPR